MLTINELHVSYGDIRVINGASLKVKKGEIVSLLGANGAGKSTLVRSVIGLTKPKKGEVMYLGESIFASNPHTLLLKGLVLVPEGRMLFSEMSVEENLLLGAFLPSLKKESASRLAWILELFPNLKRRLKQQAGNLSGGEQQMLALGRALMGDPKLLILDEPSIGLAPKMVEEVFRVIQSVNQRGVSVLLIEQSALAALHISHYGFVLGEGKVAFHGSPEALLSHSAIKSAYLGL